MSGTTGWRITHDGLLRRVTITLETDDPEIVALVEASARKQGVRLARILDKLEPDEPADEAGA